MPAKFYISVTKSKNKSRISIKLNIALTIKINQITSNNYNLIM